MFYSVKLSRVEGEEKFVATCRDVPEFHAEGASLFEARNNSETALASVLDTVAELPNRTAPRLDEVQIDVPDSIVRKFAEV